MGDESKQIPPLRCGMTSRAGCGFWGLGLACRLPRFQLTCFRLACFRLPVLPLSLLYQVGGVEYVFLSRLE